MSFKLNPLGILCLDEELKERVMGDFFSFTEPMINTGLEVIEEEIPTKKLPEIPPLPYGDNVSEYFSTIAQRYFDYHRIDDKVYKLMSIKPSEIKTLKSYIPKLIDKACAGVWTKIKLDGHIRTLDTPDSDSFIFDTETFVRGSSCKSPIVGQALGKDYAGNPAMYLWLHPAFDRIDDHYVPQKISIGNGKLIVGHNLAFDWQKVIERYTLQPSNTILLDTMTMMQLVGGADRSQRWALNTKTITQKVEFIRTFATKLGLIDCFKFMTGKEVPEGAKELRDVFKKAEKFQEFRDNFKAIMEYSLLDLFYTYDLFVEVYPKFLDISSHKAILAGQTIVADALLPCIDYWDDWKIRCHDKHKEVIKEMHSLVFPYLKDIHDAWLEGKFQVEGSRLETISWEYVRPFNWRKEKPLPDDWEKRASWFEPFRKGEIKYKGRNLQVLCQIYFKYKNEWYRTEFVTGQGWCIKVNGDYMRLPNKSSPGENFGNLLSSDAFDMASAEDPILTSTLFDTHEEFVQLLKLIDSISLYTGFHKRIESQNKEGNLIGAEVKAAGTISGRTVSSLFNTLPTHFDYPKIMSEIKSTMQAPEGWVFVGGDIDQQEASVAAAMSDSFHGWSGSNEFSRAILVGDSSKGTDYHSIMAKKLGIKRSIAKNVDYGLIYGAGVKTTSDTIRKGFNQPPSDDELKTTARSAVHGFKGVKDYDDPCSEYSGGIASNVFNKMLRMIRSGVPRGLFFGNEWPRSLQPKYCKTDGSPPQLNYCIQASCSTYGFLSALVLSISDEIRRQNVRARFSISIHDEAWFLCRQEDAMKLVKIFQICHARCWALLHYNLELHDLPLKRAFMSGVSVDKVLRKSYNADTSSPTFEKYPPGLEFNIWDLE